MHSSGAHRRRGRIGAALMAVSLAVATAIATLAPAVAQEGEEGQELETEKTAQYAAPATDSVPDTAAEEFPPGVVCILFPQPCGEETAPVRDPVTGELGETQEQSQPAPAQPTPPDGLTMSVNGGELRYLSGFDPALPDVPEGQQIDQFVLTFSQQSAYHSDSPAFRQAVLAAVAAAGAQDPEVFAEEFEKALDEEQARTEQVMGLEACPFTKPFEPTEYPQTRPYEEIPRNDDGELAIDCIFGANGVYDQETETWSFDLTLAAQSWSAGDLSAEGILIRPTSSPNVAYGDPDPSTNAQVVLANAATAAVETSEPPPPPESFDTGGDDTTGTGGTSTSAGGTSGGGTAAAPTGGSGSSGSVFAQPPASTSSDEQPASVAPPAASTTDGGADQPAQEPVAAAPTPTPTTPWWIWLLAPTFLAGAYLVSQSLVAGSAIAPAAAGSGGAMTRLIQKRQSGELIGSSGPATA